MRDSDADLVNRPEPDKHFIRLIPLSFREIYVQQVGLFCNSISTA